MLKDVLESDILRLIEARDWTRLREALAEVAAPEIADTLEALSKTDRVLLFRALPREREAEVLSHMEAEPQHALLTALTDEETRQLLAELPPDDRTNLLEELPGQATQRILNLLDPADLKEARWLLGYPEGSVGRLMTPDYVAVRAEWSAHEALRHIRQRGRLSETINRIYVVDRAWRLIDDLDLRRFILAEPDATVAELMDHSFVAVAAAADRREAVNLIRRYDITALPVVDSDGVLLGIVTVDDVLDVAEEEATEDFHRVGSVGPLKGSLREAGITFLYRRRIGWLMALVFMNILSGAGIAYYEDTIAAVVALVFFLPLLIGSAGNAGAQAATLMIRALATGDVRAADWLQLLGKELAVSALIGATMAIGVALVGLARAPEVVLIVSLTMFLVVMVGSLLGMSLPFVFTRFGWDPATASAPLVTSLADISGVLIYFSIASRVLGT
jgi:magnesium transporter